ncbi:MAG: YihY/virulence factor BrkB family protein [Dehalococcoidia bacterium]
MTAQRLSTAAGVVKEAFHEFLADNCPHLAAAISYYFLLSLFPLALAAISIFGFILRSEEVEARVTEAIADLLPVSADFVARTIHGVAGGWGAAGIIATVGLIWAGMAVFNVIRKSLNTAWGIREPRPFLHERMLEFVMMIGLGLLLIMSLGLTTTFKIVQEANSPVFGGLFVDGGLLWRFLLIATSTVLIFLTFLFLYKVVPNTRVRWRHAFLGALVAAILFELVKNIFIWFVGNFATYNLVYGSVGTIVALMSWTYISALIVLFCAKLTSIYPKVISSLAAAAPAEADSRETQLKMKRSVASMVLVNMALLTSGGLSLFRRKRPGKN